MKSIGLHLGASATAIVWLLACGTPVQPPKLEDGGPDSGLDAGLDGGLDGGPAGCQLDISPASLDFGDVTPGASSSTQSVTLANTGTDVCLLKGLNLGYGSDSAFTLLSGPFTSQLLSPLSGGPDPSSLVVQVGFSPREIGPFSGALDFELVDPDGGTLEESIPLSGTGSVVGNSCFILPQDLSVGTVGVSSGQFCSRGKRKVVAINDCPFPVKIASVTIVPADSPVVLIDPTVFPIVVGPDSTSPPILLGFTDNGAPGEYSAVVLIQTDLREIAFSFTIHGTIPTPNTQTDNFTGELLTLDHQFPLSGVPVPSSLALSLNDAPLPTADWSYDSVRNVVVVSGLVTFHLSDVLAISYWLSCN